MRVVRVGLNCCVPKTCVCLLLVLFFLADRFSIAYLQLRKEYGITMKQKIRRRTSSYWRNLNSLCVIVYVVALMVRLISQHAPMGKSSKTVSQRISTCFYALSFFLWVLRLLQIISLNRKIGVYIIMLQKMASKFYSLIFTLYKLWTILLEILYFR